VDFGVRDGKRRREYFTTRDKAEKAFKQGEMEALELSRRWTNLRPHERLTVAEIMAEIRSAGLTLRDVWDGYRKGSQVTTTGRQMLRQAIDLLIAAKTMANKRAGHFHNLAMKTVTPLYAMNNGVFTPTEVVIGSHLRLDFGGAFAGGRGGGFVAFTRINSMTSARIEIRGRE
jgi:hypothetical protein